jgi:hypothetical protein
MPVKFTKKKISVRDNRDAPNTPSLHGKNTGVTHTPASAASSTVATPHARGQVEERDGKALPEPKSPEHVRTPRKPRTNTKMRDLLIEIRAAFNRWKTWARFSINQKRADGRVLHELLDRINEMV